MQPVHAAAQVPLERMGGRQLADAANDASRRRDELEGQVFVQGDGIDIPAQRWIAQQRLQL